MQFDEIVLQCFLANQCQLFPEAVAESVEEAADFLEECMAVVVNSPKEVWEYFDEADKVLVESLGGSVEALVDNNNDSSLLEDTEVEVFDINSVHYDGVSVVPYVIAIVSVVAVLAIVVVLISIRKRTYEDY